jgi:hypothetical protein
MSSFFHHTAKKEQDGAKRHILCRCGDGALIGEGGERFTRMSEFVS